jgi:hypothetical protein
MAMKVVYEHPVFDEDFAEEVKPSSGIETETKSEQFKMINPVVLGGVPKLPVSKMSQVLNATENVDEATEPEALSVDVEGEMNEEMPPIVQVQMQDASVQPLEEEIKQKDESVQPIAGGVQHEVAPVQMTEEKQALETSSAEEGQSTLEPETVAVEAQSASENVSPVESKVEIKSAVPTDEPIMINIASAEPNSEETQSSVAPLEPIVTVNESLPQTMDIEQVDQITATSQEDVAMSAEAEDGQADQQIVIATVTPTVAESEAAVTTTFVESEAVEQQDESVELSLVSDLQNESMPLVGASPLPKTNQLIASTPSKVALSKSTVTLSPFIGHESAMPSVDASPVTIFCPEPLIKVSPVVNPQTAPLAMHPFFSPKGSKSKLTLASPKKAVAVAKGGSLLKVTLEKNAWSNQVAEDVVVASTTKAEIPLPVGSPKKNTPANKGKLNAASPSKTKSPAIKAVGSPARKPRGQQTSASAIKPQGTPKVPSKRAEPQSLPNLGKVGKSTPNADAASSRTLFESPAEMAPVVQAPSTAEAMVCEVQALPTAEDKPSKDSLVTQIVSARCTPSKSTRSKTSTNTFFSDLDKLNSPRQMCEDLMNRELDNFAKTAKPNTDLFNRFAYKKSATSSPQLPSVAVALAEMSSAQKQVTFGPPVPLTYLALS